MEGQQPKMTSAPCPIVLGETREDVSIAMFQFYRPGLSSPYLVPRAGVLREVTVVDFGLLATVKSVTVSNQHGKQLRIGTPIKLHDMLTVDFAFDASLARKKRMRKKLVKANVRSAVYTGVRLEW